MKMLNKSYQTIVLIFALLLLHSCGILGKNSGSRTSKSNRSAEKVLKKGKKFLGTPYKYGGNTKKGLDCSGLVVQAFQAIDFSMPRVSKEQAKLGYKVKLGKIKKGDLLFFNTAGKGVSHVGIVEKIKNKEVFFLHASSSKGVMISSLNNRYWKPRFLYAKRVL